MTDELFDIYFSGKILPDNDLDAVKQQVGKVFKANESMLEQLFSGKAVKIKKAVNMDTAIKYRVKFREIGAIVDIRPRAVAASIPVETATQEDTQPDLSAVQAAAIETTEEDIQTIAPAALDSSLATPGSIIDETPEVPAAQINTDGMDLGPANQGSLEEFAQPVEPAKIPDISQLDISNTTEPLDATPEPPPLEVDISDMQIDAFTGPLDDTPPPPPADIDTSELTAAEANTGSLEEFDSRPEPVPLPDISKLKME